MVIMMSNIFVVNNSTGVYKNNIARNRKPESSLI